MEHKTQAPGHRLSNTIKPADMDLEAWQVALRQQQAWYEHFDISEASEQFCPGEYCVRNHRSRSQYKVIYRGEFSPWNFCSCPDFRTSGLGTCKHVEGVKLWLKAEGRAVCQVEPAYTSVYVDYRGPRAIRIRIGQTSRSEMTALAQGYFDRASILRPEAYADFNVFMEKARQLDDGFRCYPDALEMIIAQRERHNRLQLAEEQCTDEKLDALLSVPLYPYQREGVRFAIQAGRAIIGDEMGLGKTIQAIATAEIFLRHQMAEHVLIVCPTSLKYQWKSEIERFTGRSGQVLLVDGYASRRLALYSANVPYKIVSYQTLANDLKTHGHLAPDLLIMDEVGRLKNWHTQLSGAVRRIDAHYCVLLSGTPLENKLDELCSIVQLADPYCLGPLYRFRYDHIITDPETGKAVGYKNLSDIRQRLSGTLIRRTKQSVRLQLPPRTDQCLLVPMTPQQSSRHEALRTTVARLVQKWTRFHSLSEEDRRRLLLTLGQMRMLADSTFIIDQDSDSHYDVKVGEVMNILENLQADEEAPRVVIFSEWERMARLIAIELQGRGIGFEFLHGGITAARRAEMVERFTTDPACRIFLSTDAGSTGLNLQAASLIINLDLPWNPAILEQRIGRIYRIGQEMPIHVINLVSAGSIEERMVERLRFKSSMFAGALDGGEDTIFASDERFTGFMAEIAHITTPADTESDTQTPQTTHTPHASHTSHTTQTPQAPQVPADASALADLKHALRSSEQTEQLVDHIMNADRATVARLLSLMGRLLDEADGGLV